MSTWRDRILALTCTSLGFGYAPVAPGTAGTLPAVGLFLLIVLAAPPVLHTPLLAAALLAACALSVAVAPWAERHWKKKDPGFFTLDEVAGFLLTVTLFRGEQIYLTAAWAFVLTRAFDIIKLPPARQLEKLPGGWGILLDDLASSVHAAIVLHLLHRLAGGAVWIP